MFTDRYLGLASELVTKHDGGVWSSQSSGTRSARACITKRQWVRGVTITARCARGAQG